jgi:hypothetical protein
VSADRPRPTAHRAQGESLKSPIAELASRQQAGRVIAARRVRELSVPAKSRPPRMSSQKPADPPIFWTHAWFCPVPASLLLGACDGTHDGNGVSGRKGSPQR